MVKTNDDASNLPFARGDGEQHFRYFIENRINYCDSKWYAGNYISKHDPITGEIIDNFVSLRIYTPKDADGNPRTDLAVPANANITLVPYSNMYAGVRYKANGTLYQKRVEQGEEVTFEAPNEVFNDTETAIYGADQLSSLGDLAPLYCGTVNVSKAIKLTEIKIGDGTQGYVNNNLKELSVGTNKLLKKIDIQNCPSFTSALGLKGCQNIEEIYAKGSGITGVELADSGYLKIVQLPSTIANLTMKNQEYIEEFTMEGYGALKTLHVENCPAIDTLNIIDNSPILERVRLTGVEWEYEDASFLYELMDRNLAGIDENGSNTEHMWLDGTCHIETLTGTEMAEIKAMYPYLTITYDNLTADLIFMSEDGETELCRQTIFNGGNGTDPIGAGTITTPTKESTAQYDYTFSGWSTTLGGVADANALLKVEADRYVYVVFISTIRSYTVNFYSGSKLLQTQTVEYGKDATYTGSTPTHESGEDFYEFTGWNPKPTNIVGDTNCYAQFYDAREITDDWATIEANVQNGTATSLYQIGAYKNVEINYEDGTSETIPMEVIAHSHDELADDTNANWKKITVSGAGSLQYNSCNVAKIGNVTYICTIKSLFEFNVVEMKLTKVIDCPSVTTFRGFTSYNNELYIFANMTNEETTEKYNVLFKLSNNEWIEIEIPTFNTDNFPAVMEGYKNKLHIIYGEYHYTYDGNEFILLNSVASDFRPFRGRSVVFDDCIYYGNGFYNNQLIKYDGETYSVACRTFTGSAQINIGVYNGELYMVEDKVTKKFNPTTNTFDSLFNELTLIIRNGILVEVNGKFYVGLGENTSGYVCVLENPKATLTFMAKNLLKDDRKMKTSGGTSNGWIDTDVRTYLNEEFLNYLETSLQSSIKLVKKYSSISKTDIGFTNDKIFIPSSSELGLSKHSYIVDGQGEQYPVFTDGLSRKKYKLNNNAANTYWTRSLCKEYAHLNYFNYINDGGSFSSRGAGMNEYGILVGFCI